MGLKFLSCLASGMILSCSLPLRAEISNVEYTGYSQLVKVGTATTIYGGVAGSTSDCDPSALSTDVCNNCLQTAGTIAACNTRRIQPTTLFRIQFKTSTEGYPKLIKGYGSSTPTVLNSISDYVSANGTATISLTWSDLCSTLPTGGTTTCTVDTSGGVSVDFGISKDNTTTLNERATISIQITGASLCPTSSDTEDQTLPSTAACTNATSGIYAFTAKPGDAKVYMKELAKTGSSTFPTSSTGIQYSKIRYYYEDGDCTTVSTVRNASSYFETTFSLSRDGSLPSMEEALETSRTNFTPDTDRFSGLANGVTYVFKVALLDQAGNVGMFTPDNHCGDDVSAPATVATYGDHSITPDEVVGLLTEKNNCFIATAAYGSAMDPHVQTLRDFRDRFLIPNTWGKAFVRGYYDMAPAWARWISQHPFARSLARYALWPVVGYAEISMKIGASMASLLFATLLMLPLLLIRLRGRRAMVISAMVLSALIWPSSGWATRKSLKSAPQAPVEDPALAPPSGEETSAENPPATATPPENPPAAAVTPAPTAPPSEELGPPQEPPYTQVEDEITAPPPPNPEDQNKKSVTETKSIEVPKKPLAESETDKERHSREGLMKVTKKGEYIYRVEGSQQTHAMSFRGGMFSPPSLYNGSTNLSFSSVYGTSSRPILFVDYEWQLFRSAGKLGVKIGSGIFTTSGNGYFKSTLGGTNTRAEEVYSFFLFPNNIAAIYRAQFFEKQFLVPYAEAGADYMTFAEIRDDGAPIKYGGSLGYHLAFGGSFLLDWLDKESVFQLDKDYGVNHIWLTGEYRIISTPSARFDFSENVINGGITVEY